MDKCHNDYHERGINLEIPRPSSDWTFLKEAQHVMQGKTYLRGELSKIAPLSLTYGYITSERRKKNNFPKEHFIDAVVIANPAIKEIPNYYFSVRFLPCQQRKLFFSLPKKGKGRVPYEVNDFVATDGKRVIVGKNPKLFGKTDVPRGESCEGRSNHHKPKALVSEANTVEGVVSTHRRKPASGVGELTLAFKGFTVFRKGDLVKVKGFIKEINSIYSNGALAFARIKGSSSPTKVKLLRKRETINYNICLYSSIN